MRKLAELARRKWRLFKEAEPGSRFQRRFRKRQLRRRHAAFAGYGRFLNLVGGIALIAAGFALAWVLVALGLLMLAGESLAIARVLDRGEVKLRGWARAAKAMCKRHPLGAGLLAALTVLAILASGIYLVAW